MKKKFHEMTSGEYMKILDDFACEYCKQNVEGSILRNKHMNKLKGKEKVSKIISDAIIVDFVNFAGMKYGLDYGLHTKDLTEKERKVNDKKEKRTMGC